MITPDFIAGVIFCIVALVFLRGAFCIFAHGRREM